MIVLFISVIIAVIFYVVGKKRAVAKNNFKIIENILWVEACVFMAGYFVTDRQIYKLIWNILLAAAAVFLLVYSVYLKREK